MASIGFDIYGTLIDPFSIGVLLKRIVGDKSDDFNNLWREKQLEYSFRHAVMKKFPHFSNCTRMALIYCDEYFNTNLSKADFNKLLDQYKKLPCYPEVESTLEYVRSNGNKLYAFSNGDKEDLVLLLTHAGIINHFQGIISVEEVGTFKPAPEVYELLIRTTSANNEAVWLVSANAFDIIGASACNIKTVWLRRNQAIIYDPFGYEPDCIIDNLSKLKNIF